MSCERYKACHDASFLSWPGGLAVNICDDRAARRRRRRFKSGCAPIFLYLFSADPQRLSSAIYSGVGTDLVDSRELFGMGT